MVRRSNEFESVSRNLSCFSQGFLQIIDGGLGNVRVHMQRPGFVANALVSDIGSLVRPQSETLTWCVESPHVLTQQK